MNPKISDFGLAKMFGGNVSQANTIHIAGTYGYMSPEYALEGRFSIKSDVFSFGVLQLEVISGKKNTGFYQSESLNLLSHAWELWCAGKALQLVDPALEHDLDADITVMRYINVALLCVQEIAGDRLTMSEVVSMLTNENITILSPKQAAFSNLRSTRVPVQPISPPELCSQNGMTVSAMKPR
ncbi:hypothetical protein CRG98_028427 [Punica granatum]|uniref:Protein kinase domain-containing protein n=1 Tax=Punica granatum TaxID=22663 RepID=A0A2I0J5E9_PUNGR|nr:hypothetical protein CRG98_028427 [Punica granatum]